MKQPNWKTPLILSGSLLAIGTFAYWLQYSHKPKKDRSDLLTKKPIALATDETQVAMIKIKGIRGLIELKCESIAEKKCTPGTLGKWTISHPIGPNGQAYLADSSEVKDFLDEAANAVAAETIDLQDELAEKRKTLLTQYGLADEQRADTETQFVELVLADGKRLTAWFGVEHPIGDKTFVASATDGKINDQTVFLVSNQSRDSIFTKTAAFFRNKSLYSFDRKDIASFTARSISGKKPVTLSAKKEKDLWTINGHLANHDRVETLLATIANAKAIDFADSSLIKGLKPILQIDLQAGEKKYVLSLYEKKLAERKLPDHAHDGHDHDDELPAENRYYLQSSEQKELAQVEPSLKTGIAKSETDLRNTMIFSEADKNAATEAKFTASNYGASPEFHQVSGKWVAKDPKQNWDTGLVFKLIEIFAATRVKGFVTPPPAGKELFTASIGDEKAPEKFHYTFFLVKDAVYARDLNAKTNEAYLMEESLRLALPKTENEWKIKTETKK